MKERFFCFLIVVIFLTTIQRPVLAATTNVSTDKMDEVLIKYGYTRGTAEAMQYESKVKAVDLLMRDPSKANIQTTILEVDVLSEIESFLSCTDEELLSTGVSKDKINQSKNDINKILNMDNQTLRSVYGINDTEIKMLRQAAQNGKKIREGKILRDNKNIENPVNASGSITEAEMSYTQLVFDISNGGNPTIWVNGSYNWNSVFFLGVFTDDMAFAWGGGLNAKNISGSADYYTWDTIGGPFGSYAKSESFRIEHVPQAGMIVKFPQASNPSGTVAAKTKSGSVTFTLYQTQRQGYDTRIVSCYSHQVLVVTGGISITASGPSVDLSVGLGYDSSPQRSYIISY
jgi:hypothetical protein